jgi:hypothetical protein
MLTPNYVNPVNPLLLVESTQPKAIYRLSI